MGAFCNIAKLVATGLLVYIAGVLIDARESAAASPHEAALHAWTVIMAAAAVLLVILRSQSVSKNSAGLLPPTFLHQP